jgi:hypothetical protein
MGYPTAESHNTNSKAAMLAVKMLSLQINVKTHYRNFLSNALFLFFAHLCGSL